MHYEQCKGEACEICAPARNRKKKKLCDDQNRLRWVVHSQVCTKPEGQCAGGVACWKYQTLWHHMKDCNISDCRCRSSCMACLSLKYAEENQFQRSTDITPYSYPTCICPHEIKIILPIVLSLQLLPLGTLHCMAQGNANFPKKQ